MILINIENKIYLSIKHGQSMRTVVELGCGDGVLLHRLSKKYKNSFLIGIELDKEKFQNCLQLINAENVKLINDSFLSIVPFFENNSIEKFIAILPDPKFIDLKKQETWQKFYSQIFEKLKKNGVLIIITEITDEMLNPVSIGQYNNEVDKIECIFNTIGFKTIKKSDRYPSMYSTTLLKKFSKDKERIKIVFFSFLKK